MRGSFVQYADDVARSESRYDASIVVDNAYRIGNGIKWTFGGYYLRDELRLNQSNNAGGYTQFSYNGTNSEAFLRLRSEQVAYIDNDVTTAGLPSGLIPFARNGEFSVRRTEATVGGMVGITQRIGMFAELGSAVLDYFDQKQSGTVDRDASEITALAGLRVTLAPDARLDVGYRVSRRDFDDGAQNFHSTGFLDAKLVWAALTNLTVIADVDRALVEPVSLFALAGEQTTYGIRLVYTPVDKVELGLFGRYRVTEEIGEAAKYNEVAGGASASYALTDKSTAYAVVDVKHVEEDVAKTDFDRVRFGVGVRSQF